MCWKPWEFSPELGEKVPLEFEFMGQKVKTGVLLSAAGMKGMRSAMPASFMYPGLIMRS